eukprot:TRINITY_DN9337_c0_g5_i1.p1 TRINITY_DN9337_c0_g5~~TRINITY_DN9337_c0_g5_i1.p1  ORF type:complete len:327 (-),score=69.21 TRINITY_DN9337_c0_g5_i1:141-1121(-)
MKWLSKEYDIVPEVEAEGTGLIADTQIPYTFPSCYRFSLSAIGTSVYILGSTSQSYPLFYRLDVETLELCEECKREELAKLIDSTFVHSAFVCNERIYILSNVCPQNGNCMAIYDPESQTFYPIKGDTRASTFRMNYTVDEHKGLAYLFGGLNENCEPLNTVEVFDITTYRWHSIETHGEIPPPRHNHVSYRVKDDLYIFGGTNEISFNDPSPLTDMYKLNLTTLTWNQVMMVGNSPRGNALTMGAIKDDMLMALWSDNGEVKASLYSIDRHEWKDISIEGNKPKRRHGVAGLITREKGVLFGGFSEVEYRDVAYCNVLDIKLHCL